MTNAIHDLLKDIPLPRIAKVRQKFPSRRVADITASLRTELAKPEVGDRVKPGMRIAIAVGSRGMDQITAIVRITAEELKKRGAAPFIVPAMGSHGGATAAGQRQILANLGVTEESVQCPVVSSMDVVTIGELDNGLPVVIDKNAYEADGIVVINRIKAHNAFSGPSESGLVKMITIGLGKQQGADACHTYGIKHMAETIVKVAEIKLARTAIIFGIGTVENAYHQIARIDAIPAEDILKMDRQLLVEAKANMPRLLFDRLDVLVVKQLGKEFSGGGLDPYVTGRTPTPYIKIAEPTIVSRLAVLDVSERSHGNTCGMGSADVTTRRLFNKIDFASTYMNVLTARGPDAAKIPLIMDNDRLAIQAAIKTSSARDLNRIRLVMIKNTLQIGEIYVAGPLLAEVERNENMEIVSGPAAMKFTGDGELIE